MRGRGRAGAGAGAALVLVLVGKRKGAGGDRDTFSRQQMMPTQSGKVPVRCGRVQSYDHTILK